jgi:hypothetical protein
LVLVLVVVEVVVEVVVVVVVGIVLLLFVLVLVLVLLLLLLLLLLLMLLLLLNYITNPHHTTTTTPTTPTTHTLYPHTQEHHRPQAAGVGHAVPPLRHARLSPGELPRQPRGAGPDQEGQAPAGKEG